MALRRKGFAVVAAPIVGLCLATTAFIVAGRQNNLSRRSVERGEAVTAQLRLVFGLVIDAENSARGFVLTGEQRFLEPLVQARDALPGALVKLDSLFGQTGQRQTATTLRPLIERRLRISEELGRQPARAAVVPDGVPELLDESKRVMDAIRQEVSELEAVERSATVRARAQAERAEELGRAALAAGLVLGLIGGLGGNVLFTRGVARRVVGLLGAADDLAHGNPVAVTLDGGADEVGRLGLALAQASDLLRQREQALDDARRFLARLLDAAPTVVLRIELPSLDCGYVSSNAERVFGVPAVPEPDLLRARLEPDALSTLQSAARCMAEDGKPVRMEALFSAGGGQTRWVTLVMLPELDEPAGARRALVYLHDDDERYRAQHDLKEREATLQAVLDASPDMITITAADGRVALANPAVEAVLGRSPDELLQRSPFDWIHPDDRAPAEATFEALVEGTKSRAVATYRVPHVDGRLVALESHASTLRDGAGQAVGVLAVTRDISERVRMEEMQRAAREAAERASRSKSEFVSRMSHELRTPLNAVIGFAQLLELDDLTPEHRESVGYILKGGRHLLDLIDEILDIARIESGRLKLSTEPVSLTVALNDVAEMVAPLAAAVEVDIQRSLNDDVHVFADRQRLIQILLNLLSNAIKYNRPRGTVQVTCRPTGDGHIRIDVSDTGFGIRSEDLSLLFAPFERLGAEQTGIEGTGIGLTLSQQLAEAMGGSLEVSTVLGRGSTFSLVLPEAEAQVERYERLHGDSVRSTIGSLGGTVLHIEDNLSNLKLVERILARHASVRVVATMQGRLGIQLAREHRPRLVLLDLHLPDIGGDEVLRQLRDDPVTAGIPVVIVSADATRGEVQRLLAAGAAGYVTKPIDVRELLRLLDDLLIDGSDD